MNYGFFSNNGLRGRSLMGVGALFLSSATVLQAATNTNKPNFLFIITDQYRYDLIRSVQDDMPRYDGKTKIRTPNLDRLRREGAYFKNAYTQCSVCVPARATFRTGNTIERHGVQSNDLYKESVYDNDARFQDKIEADVTFDQILVENRGYAAEHFGKWHIPRIFLWSQDYSTPIMQYNDADFTGMTSDTDYAHIVYSFVNSDGSLSISDKLADGNYGLSKVEEVGMQKDTLTGYPYIMDAIDTRYGLPPYTSKNPDGKTPVQPDLQGRLTLPANRTPSYFEGTAAVGALERLAQGDEPFCLDGLLP